MATATPKLGLRKPAGSDLVNVVSDIGTNMDIIDATSGPKAMFKRTTAGPYSVTSSALWVGLDATADLVLKGTIGDWVEVSASGLWGNELPGGYLDVVSTQAGVPVVGSAWGAAQAATDTGIQAWAGNGSFTFLGGSVIRRLIAADLDANSNVTLKIMSRCSSGTKTLYCSAINPFTWHAINLGQP